MNWTIVVSFGYIFFNLQTRKRNTLLCGHLFLVARKYIKTLNIRLLLFGGLLNYIYFFFLKREQLASVCLRINFDG